MSRRGRATATTGGVVRGAIFAANRQQRAGAGRTGAELRALRERAGPTQAEVARAIGVDRSVICRLEQGSLEVSMSVVYRVGALLGAKVRVGVYPDGQPLIHDAGHAGIVEALLLLAHGSWQRSVEAPVPGRPGSSVDVQLDRGNDVVLFEVESRVRRFEEIVRECHAKQAAVAATLPDRRVHVVLVLPPTRHNRALVREHRATIAAAFPASSDDIRDALTADRDWPGNGILWFGASTSLPTRRPQRGRGR